MTFSENPLKNRPVDPLYSAYCSFCERLPALDRAIDQLVTSLDAGEYDDRMSSHIAWLLDKLSNQTERMRRIEDQHAKAGKRLSPDEAADLMVQYIAICPTPIRERIRKALDEQDDVASQRSILAQ